jgi:hypothetical protein
VRFDLFLYPYKLGDRTCCVFSSLHRTLNLRHILPSSSLPYVTRSMMSSNHVTLATLPSSSGRASFPSQNDRERSRNAKAQARHRAKRKAYVEQLEQTVTKLQSALALSSDDMSTLPAPLDRIRELEDENARLHEHVAELKRQIENRNAQLLRPDIGRRTSASDFNCDYDERGGNWDPEYKKTRFANQEVDRDFMLRPAGVPSRNTIPPPPPLHIPPMSQYNTASPHLAPSRHMYQQNGSLAYQSPLSTSSSSSSPSFSPHHLSPTVSRSSANQQHILPSINGHYPVKVEDDCYLPTPTLTQSHQYTYTPNEPVSVGTNPWHAYPSERQDIQQ